MHDVIAQYGWIIGGLALAAALLGWLVWYGSKASVSDPAKFKLSYLLIWPYLIDRQRARQPGQSLLSKRAVVGIVILLIIAVVAILTTPPRGP